MSASSTAVGNVFSSEEITSKCPVLTPLFIM